MVSGKWVVIALTASLAINVFLAGLFVGRQMAGPPPPFARFVMRRPQAWRPGDPGLPPFVERIANGMAPQYRTILLSAIDKHRTEIMTAGLAFREARMKMRQILVAKDFDRQATEAALTDLREKESAFHGTLQSAFLDAAEQLPVEGRRELVNPPPLGSPPGAPREPPPPR